MDNKNIYDLPFSMVKAALSSAEDDLIKQHFNGVFDEGDPNHPMYNNGINYTASLFGRTPCDLMSMQYKSRPRRHRRRT